MYMLTVSKTSNRFSGIFLALLLLSVFILTFGCIWQITYISMMDPQKETSIKLLLFMMVTSSTIGCAVFIKPFFKTLWSIGSFANNK